MKFINPLIIVISAIALAAVLIASLTSCVAITDSTVGDVELNRSLSTCEPIFSE